MRIPESMPVRPVRSERAPTSSAGIAPRRAVEHAIVPAACCAEVCVNVPFVGRVCHCALDLPVCP
jgi:hypothetical protein